MSVENYLSTPLQYGITRLSQYLYLFVLSVNPILFTLFELRHYVFFGAGVLLSIFQHRAILPFMLIILLDLNYSKLDKTKQKWMLLFFGLGVAILFLFGSAPL